MTKWVRQEDPHGCAIAALAMITGQTYADVKEWFVRRMPDHDFARHGITHYPQDDFLAEHGYAAMRKHAAYCNVRRAGGWPPAPFAPVHLCSVSSPLGGHMVVMMVDGVVLDPTTPTPTTLGAWGAERVHYVHGVWKVRP